MIVYNMYKNIMNILVLFALPLLLPYLLIVKKRRKTALYRLNLVLPEGVKRRNRLPVLRPKKLWVHAMSVGEVVSAIPLVRQLKASVPDAAITFTVSTLTGYQTARQMLANDVNEICFYPYDLSLPVKSIADRIRPDMCMLVESDCWPIFVNEMKKRNIPLVFVNARLSDRTFSSWMKMRWLAWIMFSPFSHICVQCDEDARRFQALGIDKRAIKVTGNIKFDQHIEPVTEKETNDLRHMVGAEDSQKIWVAGSTHNGEEQIIAESFGQIKKTEMDLMLVVAPRDPSRSREVEKIFTAAGFTVMSLTEMKSGNDGCAPEVVVIDRIGLLRRLYAIADIALVGGSLIQIKGIGGHNPLEPAAFSKPIVFGKNMKNFADIAQKFISEKGAIQVADANALSDTIRTLLSEPERASVIGKRANSIFVKNKGALKSTLEIINGYVTNLPEQEERFSLQTPISHQPETRYPTYASSQ